MIHRAPPALVILSALPLRVALALGTDLSPDEAYYLVAARREGLVPPLVDHPPLIPWLLRLTDRLAAFPVELRVRAIALVLSTALAFATVALARQRGADAKGQALTAWLATYTLLPTTGGFVTTPDAPALLALMLVLAWAEPVKDEPSPSGIGRALQATLVGIVIALGALSKVVVLPLVGIVALVAIRRTTLERLLLLVPLAASAPLFATSLRFQLHHAYGQSAPTWTLGGALSALSAAAFAQAFLWTPWVLVVGVRRLSRAPRSDQAVVLGMTTLLVVSALSRAVPPEPNWFAPAALVLVVSASRAAQDLAPRAFLTIISIIAVPTAVAAAHTLWPFLPLPERRDPTARLHGWSTGHAPTNAPGTGPYGPAAEACVYENTCSKIDTYFQSVTDQHSK